MSNSILLGYVKKPFGIKGGVAMELFNPDSQALDKGTRLMAKKPNEMPRTLEITQLLDGGRAFFADISDREEAQRLTGSEIWIERNHLPVLEQDEYYLSDLLGASVVDPSGMVLGTLKGYASNNAQMLLEVQRLDGKVASIPKVKPLVKSIDHEHNIITLDLPEGLLELAGH